MKRIKFETMKHKITIMGKTYLKSYNFSDKQDCNVCDLGVTKKPKHNDIFLCHEINSDCYEGFVFKREKKNNDNA